MQLNHARFSQNPEKKQIKENGSKECISLKTVLRFPTPKSRIMQQLINRKVTN